MFGMHGLKPVRRLHNFLHNFFAQTSCMNKKGLFVKTFKDKDGRDWEISLNLDSAIRVKDALGVDLLQPELGDPPLITRLGTDEMLLGAVICALLDDQFEKHDVSASDVRKSMDGATIMAAQTAFYEELIGFFRSRGREDRASAVAKQAKVISLATKVASEKINNLDLDKLILGKMSGKLPEPLD